ncbi:hypothetical protein [Clostridium omnivorum]|nr:hypothetical protein [Clostridium sp. E14]
MSICEVKLIYICLKDELKELFIEGVPLKMLFKSTVPKQSLKNAPVD